MIAKFIGQTAYSAAYAAWFSDYTAERRRQKKRNGAALADFPGPPTSPEDIAQAVEAIGARRVLAILGIHRATLARWLSGACVIPRPSWLLLVVMAQGRLPGMSDDWKQFHFDGDRLALTGSRVSYSAREIAGWQYQTAHAQALARRVSELEKQNAHLLRVGDFKAANDPVMTAGRSR